MESFAIAESYVVPSSIKFNPGSSKLNVCSFGPWDNPVLYNENKEVLLDSVNDPKTIELYSTMNGNPVDVTLDGTQFNWGTATVLAMEFDSE